MQSSDTLSAEFQRLTRATRGVYAFTYPKTEQIHRSVLTERADEIIDSCRDAWTQKQDLVHERFFNAWRTWVSDDVLLPRGFEEYPTAGSNEGLRQIIAEAKTQGFEQIICFKGDYEGVLAYASACDVKVVTVDRDQWTDATKGLLTQDVPSIFYITQPSSIDGNIWLQFDRFIAAAQDRPWRILLDLTYVGCVAVRHWPLTAVHTNIDWVIFSLSKPFGAYYQRIGGCLARKRVAGLWGNKWFKNTTSLLLGTALLDQTTCTELPQSVRKIQIQAVKDLNSQIYRMTSRRPGLTPSDVVLIAHKQINWKETPSQLVEFIRGSNHLRFCLTPAINDKVTGRQTGFTARKTQ